MKKSILLSSLFLLLTNFFATAQLQRTGVTVPTLEVNLFAKDMNNSIYLADGILINFNNIFSANVDNNDVRKIFNIADNLAIRNGNYNLIVERRPEISLTDTVKLSLTSTRVGPYRFDIDPSVLSNYIPTTEAFLIDKFNQTETNVSFTNVTSYPFNVTADPASKLWDRFIIVYKSIANTGFTTIAASRNINNTITINFGTANEKAVTNYTVEQSNDGINFTSLPTTITPTSNIGGNPTYTKIDAAASKASNWYRVRINNVNGTTKYSSIAMVAAVAEVYNTAATMSIYPNPVENNSINLHLDNQPKGIYNVVITNTMGQVLRTERIDLQNNLQRNIYINNLSKGTYQATIIDASGKRTNIAFVAK
jgi:trimeric autotransporter adhesin